MESREGLGDRLGSREEGCLGSQHGWEAGGRFRWPQGADVVMPQVSGVTSCRVSLHPLARSALPGGYLSGSYLDTQAGLLSLKGLADDVTGDVVAWDGSDRTRELGEEKGWKLVMRAKRGLRITFSLALSVYFTNWS